MTRTWHLILPSSWRTQPHFCPLSVLQPLRVKIPEMLQAEIGKLLVGQVTFLVPSCTELSGNIRDRVPDPG